MTDDCQDDRFYPRRPIVAASCAVFRAGRVLLASRTGPPSRSLFSLPGGLVQTGETLEDAALRELFEEVGVSAEIAGFAGQVQMIERDEEGRVRRHFVICAFAGRWLSGEGRTSNEVAAIIWAGHAEIAALQTTPGLAGIVDKARRMVARTP